jgi:hypothetical protein
MCFFRPLTSSVKKMALDEPMAIIIESSLSGQGKQGNMSVSCFFLLLLLPPFIGIIQIARHASRVGGWACPTGRGK